MSAPRLRDVSEAHNRYAEMQARWGDDNQQTVNAMVRYWDLRTAYEASGREYRR